MLDLSFNEFTVPSLDDFVDGDRGELLLCSIRDLRKYLSWMEECRPGIKGLFVLVGRHKKRVSRNTISLWLHSVISLAHASALRFKAHKIRKVAMSLLFKRNCVVHQSLKVGTWSAQLTFSSYLGDVTHKHLDTFSIGPVVATQ